MTIRSMASPSQNQAIQIISQNDELRVSSLAIAEGTEREHASVIKLARTQQTALEAFGRVGFEIRPLETAGGMQRQEIALLNEHQATLLVTFMRNSKRVVAFKVALVRAFYEMREALAKPALPNFSDPVAAARAWADQTERARELEAQTKELKAQKKALEPKASFYDQVMEAGNSVQVRIAAKTIGIGPKALWDYLQDTKWVYRVDGRLTARQDKLNQGLLDTKLTSFMHPDKGRVATTICLVTPKGLDRLQKELGGLPLFEGGRV